MRQNETNGTKMRQDVTNETRWDKQWDKIFVSFLSNETINWDKWENNETKTRQKWDFWDKNETNETGWDKNFCLSFV